MSFIHNSTSDHTLYVLGGSSTYQTQISEALLSFYNVGVYQAPNKLLDQIENVQPSAVIVDEVINGGDSLGFIEKFKVRHGHRQIPVVLTASVTRAAAMRGYVKIPVLEKPYRRSQLLELISHQVNKGIEASWKKIEPVQRAALENTLNSYNSIADSIAEGRTLNYSDVTKSCEPLIQAVKNNAFQDMLRAVRGHDNYSYVHSLRVATLLSMFGAAIGIQGGDHETLTTGGLLHDVGKMKIPLQILNKPGKLDQHEFEQMKQHVPHSVGYLQLTHNIPKGVIIIAHQHHERINGSGYPNGLMGKELNQLARMAAIIDVFSALTDRRAYKPPMAAERALTWMNDMGGLDSSLLSVFKQMLLDSVPES
ncbi:HD domain-containing phosphohydrolase [Magnetovibrio sp. PR-2]|uniref:HD domain-containing phosphohydrolase n=1 Tax=Magnetovibrio sp. PR-2 TaxID=3120356 RepID=UPI002FCE568E